MTLHLYNTLSKEEQPFVPQDQQSKIVTFYSCGPTVYDYAHIGNFRSFLNADVLRRTLELLGYEVRHVMNITDVGHMVDDSVADGSGEDKMQVAARRLQEAKKAGKLPPGVDLDPNDPFAVANFYADAFLEDARTLGLKVAFEVQSRHELMPRPSQYIEPMIELVELLLKKGHSYIASDGVVYYDVQSFPEYGRLSGNTPDSIRSGEGGRVDAATQSIKSHPADFMLWKPDARHLMKWPSPWGDGYPGWHLECSVMAMELLGKDTGGVIDIHSGGEDNIFPHHECEIAQACGATGSGEFARFWIHTRHLIVEGRKMSKSAGNFFTLRDLLAKGASPASVRLELIKTHYRTNANFTFQGLQDSQRQIDRWARLDEWLEKHHKVSAGEARYLTEALPAFKALLSADLNIAGAIGVLNEAVGKFDTSDVPIHSDTNTHSLRQELEALRQMDSVLGVLTLERVSTSAHGDLDVTLIESKIEQRNKARRDKDFTRADELRDELLQMGIEIKDSAGETTWSRVVK